MTRRRDQVQGVLLSFREADAALRARNGTAARLVAAGDLGAVAWTGRGRRIPRPELERYVLSLLVGERRRPSARRSKAGNVQDPEALRALDLGDL